MIRVAAAFALALLLAVASGVAADAAPSQSVVLLDVRRFYSAECNCFKLQFSGRISSGAANEYVAIMQQKCGRETQTAVGGASTSSGFVDRRGGPAVQPRQCHVPRALGGSRER